MLRMEIGFRAPEEENKGKRWGKEERKDLRIEKGKVESSTAVPAGS